MVESSRLRAALAVSCVFAAFVNFLGVTSAGSGVPRVGTMGDSTTDEYTTYPERPTPNWVEQLALGGRFDFGVFSESSRGEPRLGGYEYNWARGGATAAGNEPYDLPGQWPGLAEQVAAGKIDYVFMKIGSNDLYARGWDILYGRLAGDPLEAYINKVGGRIALALDTVSAAGDVRLVLGNILDMANVTPLEALPIEVSRARDAGARVNAKIDAIANQRGIPVVRGLDWVNLVTAEGLSVGGVTINPTGESADPHDFCLADGHPGTVAQGLYANAIIEAFNRAYGAGVKPLSDQEILANAGITEHDADADPTYFDVSGMVVDPTGPAIADFNRDGIIDGADVLQMADYWGTDERRYDIGPEPYGDGIVDVEDLVVLAQYIGQEAPDPTLIAHWKLDETEGGTATNSSGATNAVLKGNPLWQAASGIVGGALAFDGHDDYGVSRGLLNPTYGPFSAFVWIKGGAAGQVILSQSGGRNWLLIDSAGALMTQLTGTGRNARDLHSEVVVTSNDWHRVGLTWDGMTRSLYVDDVLVAEDQPGLLPDSEAGLHIGAGANLEPDSFFSGLIDDIRIYNRAVKP